MSATNVEEIKKNFGAVKKRGIPGKLAAAVWLGLQLAAIGHTYNMKSFGWQRCFFITTYIERHIAASALTVR